MTEAEQQQLIDDHFLFDKPVSPLLLASGMARDWPDARGIWCGPVPRMHIRGNAAPARAPGRAWGKGQPCPGSGCAGLCSARSGRLGSSDLVSLASLSCCPLGAATFVFSPSPGIRPDASDAETSSKSLVAGLLPRQGPPKWPPARLVPLAPTNLLGYAGVGCLGHSA